MKYRFKSGYSLGINPPLMISTHFSIIVSSRNKKVSQNFFLYLKKTLLTNFNYKKKVITKKNRRKTMSILKAPHVHKTAQEQFEMKTYSKKLELEINQIFKFLILLKNFWSNGFPEVGLKIVFELQEKLRHKTLEPYNFLILKNYAKKFHEKKSISPKSKINKFLVVLDIYGKHVKLKNIKV